MKKTCHFYSVIIKYGIYARTLRMEMKGQIVIPILVVFLLTVGFASLIATSPAGIRARKIIPFWLRSGLKTYWCRFGFWSGRCRCWHRTWLCGSCRFSQISDNPKMQSRVFIFVGMVESIAIYGIVMMFIILGQ